MIEQTFIIIKPDGVEKGLEEEIFRRFSNVGLKIKEKNKVRLPKEFVIRFYSHLKKLPKKQFNSILDYMTSNDAVIAVLEGTDAVEKVVELCGPTNPVEAPKGTIRGDFSNDDMKKCIKQMRAVHNIIHRSANQQDASNEISMAKPLMIY